jgi:tight adherence protein C
MGDISPLVWVVFAMVSSLVLLIFLLIGGRQNRLENRLADLSPRSTPQADPLMNLARSALPRVGGPLLPKSEEERTRLQTRLIQAGYYSRQSLTIFLGVKMVLMFGPLLVGLLLGLSGLLSLQKGFLGGALVGGFGLVGPSFWLDRRKAARQTQFRRALPDALDVLVICLEGGGSFESSLRRVAGELRSAHPLLAQELNIVERETLLGFSAGEAFRRFAERVDLEEIRSLASVILQAEQYGASLVKSLRVHAEGLRVKRLQQAEEMAQKAVVKMLFPTILFIMPAMFIVILGPTTLEMVRILREAGVLR